MSHTTRIKQAGMTDPTAIADAARNMGLVPPTHETVHFFDGSRATGTAVRLPGYSYPVVVTEDGEMVMDTYNGSWGKPEHLQSLRQNYTLALVQRSMPGYQYVTEQLPDGNLRVVLSQ